MPLTIAHNVQVITAPNPGPMTFTGTQTYLIGETETVIIDPGPDDPAHLDAIAKALKGRRLKNILLTHSHRDHSLLAPRLGQAYDAPVLAFGNSTSGRSNFMSRISDHSGLQSSEGVDKDFQPDQLLKDNDRLTFSDFTLDVLHTPGHMANHLCFALNSEKILFTGDHVMGWSTSIVSPPDGDIGAFMASLDRLAERGSQDQMYLPGHGKPVTDPQAMVAFQLDHRKQREAQILNKLSEKPGSAIELAEQIYTDIPQKLLPAASRNVLAHLIHLYEQGIAEPQNAISDQVQFILK